MLLKGLLIPQNSQFIVRLQNIIDHAQGVRFFIDKLRRFRGVNFFGKFRKGRGNIAGARHGNGKTLLARARIFIKRLHLVYLGQDFLRILQKFLALRRDGNALGRAPENRDAQGLFQLADGAAEVRLRHEEVFCRAVDRARFFHFHGIFQMQNIHTIIFP